MDYCSVIKKERKQNEILTSAKTWMGLEGIVSAVSQRKTNVIRFHLHVDSKEQNKENRNKLIHIDSILKVARWDGAWGRVGQREERN